MIPEESLSILETGNIMEDDEMWAVAMAAHAAATFNAVLQRLGEKGQRVKVEVVNLPRYQQVSCELDLGVRETNVSFRQR